MLENKQFLNYHGRQGEIDPIDSLQQRFFCALLTNELANTDSTTKRTFILFEQITVDNTSKYLVPLVRMDDPLSTISS